MQNKADALKKHLSNLIRIYKESIEECKLLVDRCSAKVEVLERRLKEVSKWNDHIGTRK